MIYQCCVDHVVIVVRIFVIIIICCFVLLPTCACPEICSMFIQIQHINTYVTLKKQVEGKIRNFKQGTSLFLAALLFPCFFVLWSLIECGNYVHMDSVVIIVLQKSKQTSGQGKIRNFKLTAKHVPQQSITHRKIRWPLPIPLCFVCSYRSVCSTHYTVL